MKYVALLLLAFVMVVGARSTAGQAVVFVVRHAEKASDAGDTPLSAAGHERARLLAKLLATAGIKAIYTSDARRTKETATPLATDLGIMSEAIDHGDPDKTVAAIKTHHAGDAVLVVGHSNTVDDMVKKWAPGAAIIETDEYDRIFIVVPNGANATWVQLEYGAASP